MVPDLLRASGNRGLPQRRGHPATGRHLVAADHLRAPPSPPRSGNCLRVRPPPHLHCAPPHLAEALSGYACDDATCVTRESRTAEPTALRTPVEVRHRPDPPPSQDGSNFISAAGRVGNRSAAANRFCPAGRAVTDETGWPGSADHMGARRGGQVWLIGPGKRTESILAPRPRPDSAKTASGVPSAASQRRTTRSRFPARTPTVLSTPDRHDALCAARWSGRQAWQAPGDGYCRVLTAVAHVRLASVVRATARGKR